MVIQSNSQWIGLLKIMGAEMAAEDDKYTLIEKDIISVFGQGRWTKRWYLEEWQLQGCTSQLARRRTYASVPIEVRFNFFEISFILCTFSFLTAWRPLIGNHNLFGC